ncbi:Serine acetyltransferase [Petrocella atlantisensis]|uniref:Serine acetyltransferase n=1 Tax=Petrocella atlantisensis TaxID=2173034 RepID=A0A3P7NZ67_9FIRM|nr:acetyltransferase [Petrocella atlantisensis]VDN48544.1 Serine acetyltransferase [Petrocella atlantisensis]
MCEKILLVGGGGHGKSVLDSLIQLNHYSEIGIVDSKEKIGSYVMGIPVVGHDADLQTLYERGYKNAFVAIGEPMLRMRLFNKLIRIGYLIPNIVDRTSTISTYIEVGKGIYFGKECVVNACAVINDGVIINTKALVEHDGYVGAFAHIAPGAILCGEVSVGKRTLIGAGSIIKQQLKIGSDTVIGMGSVVLKDIEDEKLAYGNPCKEVY